MSVLVLCLLDAGMPNPIAFLIAFTLIRDFGDCPTPQGCNVEQNDDFCSLLVLSSLEFRNQIYITTNAYELLAAGW